VEAVVVAVITGLFGVLMVVLQQRLARSNSRDHGVLRDTIVLHSEKISSLGGKVGDLQADVREIRNGVRDLRDSLPFSAYEDLYASRDWSAASEAGVGEFGSDGLGSALGGRDGNGAAANGGGVKEPDPFLTARRFPEGLF